VSKKPIKLRKVWGINPRTRIKESRKVYSRYKIKFQTKRIMDNEG